MLSLNNKIFGEYLFIKHVTKISSRIILNILINSGSNFSLLCLTVSVYQRLYEPIHETNEMHNS